MRRGWKVTDDMGGTSMLGVRNVLVLAVLVLVIGGCASAATTTEGSSSTDLRPLAFGGNGTSRSIGKRGSGMAHRS